MASGDDSSPILATLEQVLDAFNRHDLEAIMAPFAEECTLDLPRGPDPWGRRLHGKAQVREGLASRFTGIPDVHYDEARHWAFGDEFGVSEWTLTGTTTNGVVVNEITRAVRTPLSKTPRARERCQLFDDHFP